MRATALALLTLCSVFISHANASHHHRHHNHHHSHRHHHGHKKMHRVSTSHQCKKASHHKHKQTHPATSPAASNSSVSLTGAAAIIKPAKGSGVSAAPAVAQSHELIQVVDSQCGATGAILKSTAQAGPNGATSWLTCGISQSNPNSPWTPPAISMDQIVYKRLEDFASTTFSACAPYISLFNKYGEANNRKYAPSESSCNPNASGDNGGAFGLMQITQDKCGGAPNGNCNDPDYNIRTGAAYFASQLQQYNGNVLLAIGAYNGWTDGLTYAQATAAANTGCCECQNNLDYLSQFLNGYAQGISNLPGVFENLKSC